MTWSELERFRDLLYEHNRLVRTLKGDEIPLQKNVNMELQRIWVHTPTHWNIPSFVPGVKEHNHTDSLYADCDECIADVNRRCARLEKQIQRLRLRHNQQHVFK